MDFQDIPELRQFVVANVKHTGRKLGTGAYGSVEEVEIPGATCAAKRIHEILLGMGGANAVKNITDRFVQECRLMSSLHHPHIVQFLGVCFLPGTQLPVLVMERMMMSLDDLLNKSRNISLATKYSILQDVARGLAYLHSHVPPVIHRDLTAKNVLLNTAMVAKLADLGVARIVHIQPDHLAATMTQAPGTAVYMPPEALEPNAKYDATIDVFSFGNLALYTLTQIFPQLKAATYVNSKGKVVGRSEVRRCRTYIEQIQQQLGHQHPMVIMIERCLCNNPEGRPTVNHILQELAGIRAQVPDRYGNMSRLEMEQLLTEREGEVLQLQQRLEHQIQCNDQELQSKDMELQSNNLEQQLKDQELELKAPMKSLPSPTTGDPDLVPKNYIAKAMALYDFTKSKADELSFTEGEVIYILKNFDDGWCEGICNGVRGLLPGNYVDVSSS